MDLVHEGLGGRQIRLIDAAAIDVVFPAVIDAADAVVLVAAEEQRGAAMRTAVVHHADAARRVAKRDQLLAEEHEAHGIAVGLQLRGFEPGQPVMAHETAHRRAGTDAGENLGILQRRHGDSPEYSSLKLYDP